MTKEVDTTAAFLSLFNRVEELMRQKLGAHDKSISHAKLIERCADTDPTFGKLASKLQAFRALRNSIVHLSTHDGKELTFEAIATPHRSTLKTYRAVVAYLESPPSALDTIAVQEMFSGHWDTPVLPTVEVMLARGYRLIPILNAEQTIVGMFTETTFLHELAAHGQLKLDRETTFRSLEERISFHLNRSLPGVFFLKSEVTLEFVEDFFQRKFANQEFVSVVCLTPSGKSLDRLDGIITAHDLPSSSGVDVQRFFPSVT